MASFEVMLTELVADMTTLKARVDAVGPLPEQMAEFTEKFAKLAAQIEALQPKKEKPKKPDGSEVIDWTRLDQEEAGEAWGSLLDWSRAVLYPMYGKPVWRPCWYRHPRLRMELTWLMAAWYYAYLKDAPPQRAGEWHSRWWVHVQKVFTEELAGCGPVDPQDRPHPKHRVEPADERDFADDEHLSAFVEADILRRPPPEPKDEEEDGS